MKKNGSSILGTHSIKRDSLLLGVFLILGLVCLGTVFFHLVEQHSRFDSFYFVVMTMSTVGYGDIVPLTIAGKVITIIYAFTGVPLFIFTASFFVENRLKNIVKMHMKTQQHNFVRLEENVDDLEENVEDLEEQVEKLEDINEELEKNLEK